MDTITQNQDMQELLKLFEQHGKKEQASGLSTLLWYADSLNRQYDAVLQQLADVQQQLARMNDKQSPAKTALNKTMHTLQERMDAAREQFHDIRSQMIAWAKDTVEKFKTAGVTALDKCASAIHFKPAMEAAQKGLQNAVTETNKAIDRAEAVGAELHTAKRHIRNALYTAVGKKPPTRLVSEGRFYAAVTAPLRGTKKMLMNMNNSTLGMIAATERLHDRAELAREHRAKPSLRTELENMKKISAARASAERQSEKAEAAL